MWQAVPAPPGALASPPVDADSSVTGMRWFRRAEEQNLPVFEFAQLRVAMERKYGLSDAIFDVILFGGMSAYTYRVSVTSAVDGKELWFVGGYTQTVPVELFERVCEVLQREQLGISPERVEAVLDHARQEMFR